MVDCSWGGFIFYIFGFVFFLVGTVATIFDIKLHITFGLKKGFLFTYGKNKFSNPLTNTLFFTFAACGGIYLFTKAAIIAAQYWKCLNGS